MTSAYKLIDMCIYTVSTLSIRFLSNCAHCRLNSTGATNPVYLASMEATPLSLLRSTINLARSNFNSSTDVPATAAMNQPSANNSSSFSLLAVPLSTPPPPPPPPAHAPFSSSGIPILENTADLASISSDNNSSSGIDVGGSGSSGSISGGGGGASNDHGPNDEDDDALLDTAANVSSGTNDGVADVEILDVSDDLNSEFVCLAPVFGL